MKLLLLLVLSTLVFAQEYVVVSNVLVKDLSPVQIRAVFLKKLIHHHNLKLVSVNLPAYSLIRKSFEKHILKMDNNRLRSYWIRQHYLGKRPPLVMKSEEGALRFIKKIQGGLSYAKIEAIDESMKILYQWKDE